MEASMKDDKRPEESLITTVNPFKASLTDLQSFDSSNPIELVQQFKNNSIHYEAG